MDKRPPAEAANYVDQIVERDRERAAVQGKEYQARRSPVISLVTLSVLFVVSTAVNLTLLYRANQPAFSDEETSAHAIMTVMVASDAIETHSRSTGTLPGSLGAVHAQADGLAYDVTGSSYRLDVMTPHGRFSYNRGDQTGPLAGELTNLMGSVR